MPATEAIETTPCSPRVHGPVGVTDNKKKDEENKHWIKGIKEGPLTSQNAGLKKNIF